MSNILVTGSTGKVGSALLQVLQRAGEHLRAATRNPDAFPAIKNVEPVGFDYTASETFQDALAGVDRVFLMEPQPSIGPAHEVMTPFLQTAAASGCKIVLMSSLSVEFDATEPLGQVESTLKASGARFVILRPNWFMDNFHTWWIEPICTCGIIPLPAGDSRSAFIDSRDIAAAAAAVIGSDRFNGRTLVLTGPESLSYGDAAGILSKVTARSIQYVPVDDESFVHSLVEAGLPHDFALYVTELFRHTRKNQAAQPTSTVEELTGRAPLTLAQYAHDHATAWK